MKGGFTFDHSWLQDGSRLACKIVQRNHNKVTDSGQDTAFQPVSSAQYIRRLA